MKLIRYKHFITALIGLGITHSANAHVRWFAPEDLEPLTLPSDSVAMWLSLLVLTVVGATLALRIIAYRIDWLNALFVSEPNFPYKWLWYLLLGLINVFMVSNLLYGDFLAPNLLLPLDAITWGVVIQAIVLIIMPWSVSLVGLLLILVAAGIVAIFPLPIALDYVFEFASVGLALLCAGPTLNKNDKRMLHKLKLNAEKTKAIGIDFLRIGLGIQLLELAVQNKLMRPEAALWFIDRNSIYNFFPTIGFEQVSNLHFVYFVGISETVLGLMLIINLARRAVLAALLCAFSATAILSGGHELTGHLPIVGVVLVLLAETSRPNSLMSHTHLFPLTKKIFSAKFRGTTQAAA